jgi:hypothetical protein
MLSTLRLTSLGLSRRSRSLELSMGGFQSCTSRWSLQSAVYRVCHDVVCVGGRVRVERGTVWVVRVVVGGQAMPLDVLWRGRPDTRVMQNIAHLVPLCASDLTSAFLPALLKLNSICAMLDVSGREESNIPQTLGAGMRDHVPPAVCSSAFILHSVSLNSPASSSEQRNTIMKTWIHSLQHCSYTTGPSSQNGSHDSCKTAASIPPLL